MLEALRHQIRVTRLQVMAGGTFSCAPAERLEIQVQYGAASATACSDIDSCRAKLRDLERRQHPSRPHVNHAARSGPGVTWLVRRRDQLPSVLQLASPQWGIAGAGFVSPLRLLGFAAPGRAEGAPGAERRPQRRSVVFRFRSELSETQTPRSLSGRPLREAPRRQLRRSALIGVVAVT